MCYSSGVTFHQSSIVIPIIFTIAKNLTNRGSDTLRNALYRHCPKYERIISEYLQVPVEQIWPSRYEKKVKK